MTSIEFREPERSDLCIDLSPLSQRRRNWERNVRHNDLDLHANRMREMRDNDKAEEIEIAPRDERSVDRDDLKSVTLFFSLSLSNHNIF